jgi:hypothetical protein
MPYSVQGFQAPEAIFDREQARRLLDAARGERQVEECVRYGGLWEDAPQQVCKWRVRRYIGANGNRVDERLDGKVGGQEMTVGRYRANNNVIQFGVTAKDCLETGEEDDVQRNAYLSRQHF